MHFEINNILGETVIALQPLGSDQQIDLQGLAQGAYILVVSNKTGRLARQFVKI